MTQKTYTVSPGEFIGEWLQENDVSQRQLALRMGVSPKHVSSLVNGGSLSPDSALKLERVTGMSSSFLLRAEATFRTELTRLTEASSLAQADLSFVDNLPCAELRKAGHITSTKKRKSELVQELMTFFRVGSLSALLDRVALPKAAYRQGTVAPEKEAIVATWLRLGEIDAEAQDAPGPFSAEILEGLIPKLRELTLQPPEHFGVELVRMLATAGVHLVYVKDLPGSKTFGATWWKNENPVIQLSLRSKDDGNFWFTLFHEIGHVLLHGQGGVFLDFKVGEDGSKEEEEADTFASEILIPKQFEKRLVSGMTLAQIKKLSLDAEIAPGVVVGRLQHDGKLHFSVGNGLKNYLEISEDDD